MLILNNWKIMKKKKKKKKKKSDSNQCRVDVILAPLVSEE